MLSGSSLLYMAKTFALYYILNFIKNEEVFNPEKIGYKFINLIHLYKNDFSVRK